MTNEERKLHRVCLANSCMQERLNEKLIVYSSERFFRTKGNFLPLFGELTSRSETEGFTHIIAVRKFGKSVDNFRAEHPDISIRFVKFDSDEYIKAVCTAGYLISDGALPCYYIRREDQVHLCLFDRKSLLFSEELSSSARDRIYTALARLVPQTSLMLCENGKAFEIMDRLLFLSDFYNGRLICAAEPAYFSGDAPQEEIAEEAPVSTAKYSPEAIKLLKEKYSPYNTAKEAPEAETPETDTPETDSPEDEASAPVSDEEETEAEETPESFVCEALQSDVPDRETSMNNIIEALFGGKSSYIGFTKKDRPKIAVMAYLNTSTPFTLALRNLCDRIDKEGSSVTVFAFATPSTGFCSGFGEGTRIIVKGDYTFSAADMEVQSAASEELSDKVIWKREILRSVGSDNFDTLLVFNTVNPFRHRIAGYMEARKRIYAASSEDVLNGYSDPELITELINRIYDRVLLINGTGTYLNNCSPMPIAYSRRWAEVLSAEPEPKIFSDGKEDFISLLPASLSPIGQTFIPAVDRSLDNIYCIAANVSDGAELKAMFEEYASDKPRCRLYLNVLQGSFEEAADLAGERITVIPERKIPLLIMSQCSRFVYPYEGGSGLSTAAAVMGLAAAKQDPRCTESLLMSAPSGDTLFCGYTPKLPETGLITDTSVFDVPPADRDFPENYDKQVTAEINSILSFERQESND